jgi:NAD(P)-dependent dehydrogenase (short-subunit alcohol dehydrogenase family)
MATLTTKTALVTGASRGIGRATALALAAAGARVIVHYGRGADEAKIGCGSDLCGWRSCRSYRCGSRGP